MRSTSTDRCRRTDRCRDPERLDASAEVVDVLEATGVLAHPIAFRLLARLRRVDADVKAGEYRFPAHQIERRDPAAAWCAAQRVRGLGDHPRRLHGRPDRRSARGARTSGRSRITEASSFIAGSCWAACGREPRGLSVSEHLPDPDRPLGRRRRRIFSDQFRKELPADAAARAKRFTARSPRLVTIASLIEREGKVDDERPLIASVIYNRLRIGMPLEVDASIEYVFPEHHDVITKRDLEIDSPYNTYLHTGLPPTPIANPGKPASRRPFIRQQAGICTT